MYYLGIIIAFFWGVGPCFPYGWWYLHGISAGDLIFLAHLPVFLLFGNGKEMLSLIYQRQQYVLVSVLFFLWMLMSLAINSLWLGASFLNLISVARSLYYLLIVFYVAVWVKRFGYPVILVSFLTGILFAGLVNYHDVSKQEWVHVLGLPVLWNPNVIGNMLGVGTFLTSFLVLARKFLFASIFLIAFPVMSILTYSKGTWIMVVFSLIANLMAFAFVKRLVIKKRGKNLIGFAFIMLMGAVLYKFDLIKDLIIFKIESTIDVGSVSDRFDYFVYSIAIMGNYPILGVGVGNFDQVCKYLFMPDGIYENPHNAFLHILTSGGLPAIVLFLIIFIYPFILLYHSLSLRGVSKALYVACGFMVFFISGNVQLQIWAQHFFWFVTGIVIGWKSKINID